MDRVFFPIPAVRAHPALDCAAWDWDQLRSRCRLEALRILRDPSAAEDATQEAMARAWRQRASCRTPDYPAPWVAQIARNEALRFRQREQSRFQPAATEAQEPVDEGEEGEDDAVLRRISVRRALLALTPQERQLVELRYGADLAQPAIAAALGMPEGTVKVRLHRIRERLRAVLKDEL